LEINGYMGFSIGGDESGGDDLDKASENSAVLITNYLIKVKSL
jgi:hypothetical protein